MQIPIKLKERTVTTKYICTKRFFAIQPRTKTIKLDKQRKTIKSITYDFPSGDQVYGKAS